MCQLEKDTVLVCFDRKIYFLMDKQTDRPRVVHSQYSLHSCFFPGSCKFVTVQGGLKPSSRQASQLEFDHDPQQIGRAKYFLAQSFHCFADASPSLVCLQGSVLSFYEHGMQGKNLLNGQVTSQVSDRHRKFRLLGSDKLVTFFRIL